MTIHPLNQKSLELIFKCYAVDKKFDGDGLFNELDVRLASLDLTISTVRGMLKPIETDKTVLGITAIRCAAILLLIAERMSPSIKNFHHD